MRTDEDVGEEASENKSITLPSPAQTSPYFATATDASALAPSGHMQSQPVDNALN